MSSCESRGVTSAYEGEDFGRSVVEAAPSPRSATALGASYHGMAWTPSVRQFLDIARSDGSPVFTTATHRRAFDLDNPGGVEALTMLWVWVKAGYMIVTSGYQYQVGFGAGKIGMLLDASAGYTYDEASAGGKFPIGGAPAPAGSSGRSSQYINGASLVMMNTGSAAQRAASWQFVKYMGSPSTNAYWDEHTNYLPLGPATYNLMRGFYRAHPALAATYSDPATWWFKPRGEAANYEAAKTFVLSEIEAAITGSTSVQDALGAIDAQGTKYLEGIVRA